MSKFTHEQLDTMTRPASVTEEQRLEHAITLVKKAINGKKFDTDDCEIFGQGSYENNTNVRNNSDVDINVCYKSAFYFDLPDGKRREDYGLTNPSDYSFEEFKNDLEQVLVSFFGRDKVIRKNKCLHVRDNSYHAEIDVVPTWRYKIYSDDGGECEGVCLFSDNDNEEKIVNYPKQHKQNGIEKNNRTDRRYKRLVRIVKNLSIRMEEDGYYSNNNVTSFLLECLTYNYPSNMIIADVDLDWNKVLREYIYYFWYSASKTYGWKEWVECSEMLYLMRDHKWNVKDVEEFMLNLWNYLEYK